VDQIQQFIRPAYPKLSWHLAHGASELDRLPTGQPGRESVVFREVPEIRERCIVSHRMTEYLVTSLRSIERRLLGFMGFRFAEG
jgi:hypothetical protein